MDEFIQALEDAAKGIQRFFEQLLTGLLDILERTYQWLVAVANRVGSYLARLFTAMGKLLVALFKLGLFYLPGIIAILIGIFGEIVWLLVVGVFWVVLITIVGLAYKKKETTNLLKDE